LYFSRGHPPRVHRNDLVVETVKARLPFAHNRGLKGSVAVSRRLQFHLAEIPSQLLLAGPVSRVPAVVARRIMLLVPDVLGQLRIHRSLQKSFGELLQQAVLSDNIFWLLVARQQFINQLWIYRHRLSLVSVRVCFYPMTVYTALFTPSTRLREGSAADPAETGIARSVRPP